MTQSISVVPELCRHCDACIDECPTHAITRAASEIPIIEASRCLECGHCGAVCSAGAIESTNGIFAPWTAPTFGADAAKAFLAGRRSIRRYRAEPIARETLDELMSIAPYASTASNAQDVSATLLTQGNVFEFASLVNDYYRSLDWLLSIRVAWPLLWFTPLRSYLENPEKLTRARERIRNFSRERD
jgi:ferredoxin